MTIKPYINDALRMAAGAVAMLLLILVVSYFHKEQNPAEQIAFKAKRVDIAGRMKLALVSASEAEKSAVLAITDEDSQIFANHAHVAMAEVERERRELGELLKSGGTQDERDLLDQFSQIFNEYQGINNNLLSLAVKNTNIKAYTLTFGPAADAINEMNAALSRLISANTDSPEAKKVMLLAFGAKIGALRIQTLLPPHIAEESDQKMERLEAMMAKEDEQVRKDLDGLAALTELSGVANLTTAASCYAQFSKIKTNILALSHENTNVRSVAISLKQVRKLMLLCQDTLTALQQSISDECIEGVNCGPTPKPR